MITHEEAARHNEQWHKLPRLLQELRFMRASEIAVEEWSVAFEWLNGWGNRESWTSFLLGGCSSNDSLPSQAGSCGDLNHPKKTACAQTSAWRKPCQGVMALEVLSLVLVILVPKTFLFSKAATDLQQNECGKACFLSELSMGLH
ncbi:hypothetical protein BSKO_12412 [Bryopsis sp. KO-2023]|nr:hypothetical protein BSKO_12412 [Bryopsis sp. KO-2023]